MQSVSVRRCYDIMTQEKDTYTKGRALNIRVIAEVQDADTRLLSRRWKTDGRSRSHTRRSLHVNWSEQSGRSSGRGTSRNLKKRRWIFPDGFFTHIFHRSFICPRREVHCCPNAKRSKVKQTNEWMLCHFVQFLHRKITFM